MNALNAESHASAGQFPLNPFSVARVGYGAMQRPRPRGLRPAEKPRRSHRGTPARRRGRLATTQRDGTLQNNRVDFTYNEELATIDIAGYRISKSQSIETSCTTTR
jgi:hypothetical protein